jgi:hypothetical protein
MRAPDADMRETNSSRRFSTDDDSMVVVVE